MPKFRHPQVAQGRTKVFDTVQQTFDASLTNNRIAVRFQYEYHDARGDGFALTETNSGSLTTKG